MDAAQRYLILGRLIEEMPIIPPTGPLPKEVGMWLGRVSSIVDAVSNISDKAKWHSNAQYLIQPNYREGAEEVLRLILYTALGRAEMEAPVGIQGAFVPAGNQFDAFAALGRIAETARTGALIVDPYLDGAALTDFGVLFPANILLRLLAEQGKAGGTLAPAAARWIVQYGGSRPLEVRLAPPRSLHDRALFVDGTKAWTLTQSLKDFAKRSPGEIIATRDMAALKISAYEEVWNASIPLA